MRRNHTGWRIEEWQSVADENAVGWRRPSHGSGHALIDNAVEGKQDENENQSKP